MMKFPTLLFGLALGLALVAQGEDFPQWRGPTRNGLTTTEKPLATTWPKEGPARRWFYKAPSYHDGGLGSVVVAGGRAFTYISWRDEEPTLTRTLTERELRGLGWFPETIPADLLATVEKARLSEERAALPEPALDKWVDEFLAKNLTTEAQKKEFSGVIRDRLKRGAAALPVEAIGVLGSLKDKEFPTQDALDAFLAQTTLGEGLKKRVNEVVPKVRKKDVKDTLVCLDAATGTQLWKTEFPGKYQDYGTSCTPCVADGRVYFNGSEGHAYCLSAKDGTLVWKAQLGGSFSHCSVLVAGGLAVISNRTLFAFDAVTGTEVWKQPEVKTDNCSPVLWQAGQVSYLLCNTDKLAYCVELKTGRVAWSMPGGGVSTVAVQGDIMALQTLKDVSAYKISPEKAEKLWTVEIADRGASPIVANGFVYAVGSGTALCVKVPDGAVAWRAKYMPCNFSSPVLVGDKWLVAVGDRELLLAAVMPEKMELLGKVGMKVAPCSSPCFVDGKLYLRLSNGIGCFDLVNAAPATSAAMLACAAWSSGM
ncbi:MAG: PQQ-binding-like beta-propeller repeat protein, partial [Phycisphaerae bacterium]